MLNAAQDRGEQLPLHRDLGQPEDNIPGVLHHLGADLHQLLPERRERPVLYASRQGKLPEEVCQVVNQGKKAEAAPGCP